MGYGELGVAFHRMPSSFSMLSFSASNSIASVGFRYHIRGGEGMKRIFALAILVSGLHAISAAQDRGFGLGIILGEPTGISGKYWTSPRNAIDGGVAWSFRHRGFFHLHGDYLWHFMDAIKSTERFIPYVGVGGRLGAGRDDAVFGVRVSGGITFLPKGAPIDVFLEIAPILDLAPATELSANGGIGVRFFFR